DWPGEAAVDVAIVNWVKNPTKPLTEVLLDGKVVPIVSSSLRVDNPGNAHRLKPNRGIAFQGMLPGADFVVSDSVADKLRKIDEPRYAEVIRPYLSGDDIATSPTQTATRFVVDFGLRSLEEAMQYPDALQIVRLQARRAREESTSFSRNPQWWQFLWPRPVFRMAVASKRRFIAGTATGKRILFCWCSLEVVASNSTNVFALDGDAELGVLMSQIHVAWAKLQSSTLEDRIRYTPSSAFETFPWPGGEHEEVGDVARRLCAHRTEICVEHEIGLTTLYNQVDEGAWKDLRALHVELDEAVVGAYRWPKHVAHDADESNRRLLELNRAITTGDVEYRPFSG
ncbi:MAG: type IIL restriction-modification enzyme MmeI, partial [Solirubrobacteraceae bacterium]